MDEAEHHLRQARSSSDPQAVTAQAMGALRSAMWAGEQLVVVAARERIARHGRRAGFRFGANAFKFGVGNADYDARFSDLLNFATLPFYRKLTEPTRGARDYSWSEQILDALPAHIDAKGHPLVWLNKAGWPDWARTMSRDEIFADSRDYILDTVGRFRDRIGMWDVINEAHDWANDPHLGLDDMVELTRLAADSTREADPNAVRVVNSCCTWSEYVAWGECSSGKLDRTPRNAVQYARDVIAAGVDFEVVGVQMYYPYRDLFEIDRHLDLWCGLGKTVHITELGVSGSDASLGKEHEIAVPVRPWHGDGWNEERQAEWVGAYYTICYARPQIEAISWWDLAEPAWYPHGGLVNEDMSPKPAYTRLQALFDSWRP
jgi:GH35 family endo-1,4-beta-xylanase